MCRKLSIVSVLFLLVAASSCKKSSGGPSGNENGTRMQLSLDSLFLYAKETYLWYDALPSYETFNPRQYTQSGSTLANLEAELKAITNLAINPQTQQPYEFRTGFSQPLYSYVQEGNIITGKQAEVDLDGEGNDLGLGLAVVNGSQVYIRFVEPGSPAALAGIKRGMRLVQVNGSNVTATASVLNNILRASQVSLRLTDVAATLNVNLSAKTYTASPVLAVRTYTIAGKRIGYIALSRFSALENAAQDIETAFTALAAGNINNLIVDLRYNHGGYVSTAEHIANYIAPSNVNGSVMYAEHYNDLMQEGRAPILATVPLVDADGKPVYTNGRPATYADINYTVAWNTYRFAKIGNLPSLDKIAFIVSDQTASASELLINSFKPYVEVKLFGTQTYGKPVGFFGIGIDAYTVYMSQFRILNALGQGDYYSGIPVDMAAIDDVTKDFGDPEEDGTSKAIAYLTGSLQGLSATSTLTVNPVTQPSFIGMVENRVKLR